MKIIMKKNNLGLLSEREKLEKSIKTFLTNNRLLFKKRDMETFEFKYYSQKFSDMIIDLIKETEFINNDFAIFDVSKWDNDKNVNIILTYFIDDIPYKTPILTSSSKLYKNKEDNDRNILLAKLLIKNEMIDMYHLTKTLNDRNMNYMKSLNNFDKENRNKINILDEILKYNFENHEFVEILKVSNKNKEKFLSLSCNDILNKIFENQNIIEEFGFKARVKNVNKKGNYSELNRLKYKDGQEINVFSKSSYNEKSLLSLSNAYTISRTPVYPFKAVQMVFNNRFSKPAIFRNDSENVKEYPESTFFNAQYQNPHRNILTLDIYSTADNRISEMALFNTFLSVLLNQDNDFIKYLMYYIKFVNKNRNYNTKNYLENSVSNSKILNSKNKNKKAVLEVKGGKEESNSIFISKVIYNNLLFDYINRYELPNNSLELIEYFIKNVESNSVQELKEAFDLKRNDIDFVTPNFKTEKFMNEFRSFLNNNFNDKRVKEILIDTLKENMYGIKNEEKEEVKEKGVGSDLLSQVDKFNRRYEKLNNKKSEKEEKDFYGWTKENTTKEIKKPFVEKRSDYTIVNENKYTKDITFKYNKITHRINQVKEKEIKDEIIKRKLFINKLVNSISEFLFVANARFIDGNKIEVYNFNKESIIVDNYIDILEGKENLKDLDTKVKSYLEFDKDLVKQLDPSINYNDLTGEDLDKLMI